jgi:putative MATE family efflux protein
MGVAPDVYTGALGFMRVSFISLVFNFTFFVFNSIMRSIGRPNVPVLIVLGTVILNFVLDPLMIFGWGPIPGYGVMGAALTTLVCQTIASIIGIAILRMGFHGVHVKRADFVPDLKHIKRAFLLGLPASIELSARALGLMVMTFVVTSFGTLSLAAYGVGGNILQVIIIPAMGLSMAVSALAGQNIGAGNIARAASIGRLGALVGFGSLSAFGLLVFFFSTQLVAFFVPSDADVIREGSLFLRIMCLSWGFIGAQFAFAGVFRASGNMVVNMTLTISSQWLMQLPLAYVLSKHTSLGAEGIYWAVPITNLVTALITAGVYAHGGWRKKRLIDKEEITVTEEILKDEGMR